MSPICGDGVLDNLSGEQCDDRGREDGDGCSSWCKVELNLCGNGVKEEGEVQEDC